MELENKKKLKRVLVCIDWYEPGFKAGGPIRSVANIINALRGEFEFYVLTSAYDLGETESYPGIETNQWFDHDGILIKYLSKDNMKSSAIRGNVLEIAPDLIYLNSLFSTLFTLVPLRLAKKIPVIIAPRGMLGAGALAIKKNKKMTFLRFAKWGRIYRNVTWHASSQKEVVDIQNIFGNNIRIKKALNISIIQKLKVENLLEEKKIKDINMIFVGRVTRIKNLHLAIDALKKVKLDKKKLIFSIYGVIEDKEYFRSLKRKFVINNRLEISFKGALNHKDLEAVYAEANFMLMPTEHENYGHAIVEAWAFGCPVIISKNTPWLDLQEKNIGWDVSIEEDGALENAITKAVTMDKSQYFGMVKDSYNFFAENLAADNVIESNKKLFNDVS